MAEETETMDLDEGSISSSMEEGEEEAQLSADEVSDASDAEPEKDETEQELERLVFGDSAGFKKELKSWRADQDTSTRTGEQDLTGVPDADLFFLDAGPDKSLAPRHPYDEVGPNRPDQPAWEDSDDERMMVSLMAVPRLRKLRKFEGEDVVSGREYQQRLRQQFELLNPRPKWAQWLHERKSRKRRRGSDSADVSESDASGADADDDLSTQPLAQLLRSNATLTRGPERTSSKRPKLRAEVIAIERMKDIAPTQPSAITSISIHPTMPLILSSGPSSTLYLHHLAPHPTPPDTANALITSLHLKHTPLSTTAFSPPTHPTDPSAEQPKIYLSSRRRYFHIWDLPTGAIRKITRTHGHAETQRSFEVLKPSPCGRYIGLLGSSKSASAGVVNILDAATTLWIAQVVVESRKGVADFAWWGDGEGMVVAGRGGECAEWSAGERRILRRWDDEGAVGVTTIAMGGRLAGGRKKGGAWFGPERYIAVGSTAGIVNVYDRSALFAPANAESVAKPLKMLDQLATPISHLAFSPCGQLLLMASRWKRDALRLVHLPSCTVYRNWPTSKTPLGRISAVALGEYEAVEGEKRIVLVTGNEKGALRGWEIDG